MNKAGASISPKETDFTAKSEDCLSWRGISRYKSYPGNAAYDIIVEQNTLRVTKEGKADVYSFCISNYEACQRGGCAELDFLEKQSRAMGVDPLLAALESLFTHFPSVRHCALSIENQALRVELNRLSIISAAPLDKSDHRGSLLIDRELFWQTPRLWMPSERAPYPLKMLKQDHFNHPERPSKPAGLLYQRFIPWLNKTLTIRSLNIEEDLAMFHEWMNDPVVAAAWRESGTVSHHEIYLKTLRADPHIYPVIVSLDGKPCVYHEVYWAKESNLAPFYQASNHDRGWHVLVGEPEYRGKAYAVAWLTSISHYLFLEDPRTERIVAEPALSNVRQIKNFERSGFAKIKEFDFPHKRAQLVMLLRDFYFENALWWPRGNYDRSCHL